jgi:hypothetical protein
MIAQRAFVGLAALAAQLIGLVALIVTVVVL